MKNIILCNFIVFILGCSNPKLQLNSSGQINCNSYFTYNDKRFCLPKYEGMTECLSHPKIKELSDKMNVPEAFDLAFYINDNTYGNIENIKSGMIDDYVKITGFSKLEGIKISKSQFFDISNLMESNSIKNSWDDVKKYINRIGVDIQMDLPVLIEAYSPVENVKSMVMFLRSIYENEEFYVITVSNLVFINQSLVMLNYRKNYSGEESIKQSKNKNDYIISRFINENK